MYISRDGGTGLIWKPELGEDLAPLADEYYEPRPVGVGCWFKDLPIDCTFERGWPNNTRTLIKVDAISARFAEADDALPFELDPYETVF